MSAVVLEQATFPREAPGSWSLALADEAAAYDVGSDGPTTALNTLHNNGLPLTSVFQNAAHIEAANDGNFFSLAAANKFNAHATDASVASGDDPYAHTDGPAISESSLAASEPVAAPMAVRRQQMPKSSLTAAPAPPAPKNART